MKPTSNSSTQQSDSKFIYTLSIGWLLYLASRWYIILLFALIGLGYAYYKTKDYHTTYTGKVTFVLSSETGNSSAGFGGLASQLGLGNSGSSAGVFTGENILLFFKSKKVFKIALFRKIPEKNESLINYFTRTFGFNAGWNTPRLKNAFPFPDDAAQLTPVQDSLFNSIQGFIISAPGYFEPTKPDKKLVFYEVTSTTPDEMFSAYLPKFIVEETANFYISTKTQRAKQNLVMIQHQVDSLGRILNRTLASTAQTTYVPFGINPGIAAQMAPVKKAEAAIGGAKSSVLSGAYGQMVSSLEAAKVQLENDTPLFQIIDMSAMPLTQEVKDKSRPMLLYSFAGIFAALALLVLYKLKFPDGLYMLQKEKASD